jgi:hypothetical protein
VDYDRVYGPYARTSKGKPCWQVEFWKGPKKSKTNSFQDKDEAQVFADANRQLLAEEKGKSEPPQADDFLDLRTWLSWLYEARHLANIDMGEERAKALTAMQGTVKTVIAAIAATGVKAKGEEYAKAEDLKMVPTAELVAMAKKQLESLGYKVEAQS